jgi:glycosyltransferase involved in cell wall biosynthesis
MPGDGDPARVRVLQLAAHDVPRPGSFVPMVAGVLKAVARQGWSPEIVVPEEAREFEWPRELAAAGVAVHYAPMRPRRTAAAALRSLILADERETILHTHFTSFDLPAVVARASRPERTHVVWHSHDSYPASRKLRLRRRVKYLIASRRVSAVLFVGRESLQDLAGRGLDGKRALYVPNAIDVTGFSVVTPERRAQARADFGLPDAPILLHFGWDWDRKGGDLFLRAVRGLRLRGRHVIGVSVGAPPEAHRDLQALGVADAVRLVPMSEAILDLYAAADVFVSCSRSEGDPYSVLEAAACGLGIVVTAVPGQDARPPSPGMRTTTLTVAAVADGVDSLLARSADQQLDDARRTREWVEREADLDIYARRMVSLYQRLLSDS